MVCRPLSPAITPKLSVTHQYFMMFDQFFLATSESQSRPDDLNWSFFGIYDIFSRDSLSEKQPNLLKLESIFKFCGAVEMQLKMHRKPLAMVAEHDRQTMTNSVFFIGAYMIVKLRLHPREVELRFSKLAPFFIVGDAFLGQANSSLHIRDCWHGLSKATLLGWIDYEPSGLDKCVHLECKLKTNFLQIVPGKLIAICHPEVLSFEDVHSVISHESDAPRHNQQLGVLAVVRINAPARHGGAPAPPATAAAAVDLSLDPSTHPPPDVVARFMLLAEGLPGAVAVLCFPGPGATAAAGVLTALYMMKHHDFAAREAMGWLRLVWADGAAASAQELQFLTDKEPLMRRAGDRFRRDGPVLRAEGTGPAAAARLLARVDGHVAARIRALVAAGRLPQSAPPVAAREPTLIHARSVPAAPAVARRLPPPPVRQDGPGCGLLGGHAASPLFL